MTKFDIFSTGLIIGFVLGIATMAYFVVTYNPCSKTPVAIICFKDK